MITKEKAKEYAEEFLHWMNPDGWDGTGEKPENVGTRIYEIDLDEYWWLDISIYQLYEGAEPWLYVVELVDKASDCMVEGLSGEGINDVDAIADTIMAIIE